MNPQSKTRPPWTLIVKGANGKDTKAGRFETEFLAVQFAKDYRIADWRIEGPRPSALSSQAINPP